MPLGDVWGNSWLSSWGSSWKQSTVTQVQAPQRLNLGRGGGHKQKKDEYYRKLTQDLLARFYALQERTLPPPEVPVEPKPEVVMKPYFEEVGILRNKVFRSKTPDKRLTQTLKKLEADAVEIRKRIQRELDIKRIDEEVAMIAAMLDD